MCLQELSSEASELSSEASEFSSEGSELSSDASEFSSEVETWNLVSKISSNRMPMPSNDARRNLLPNRVIESFWDALWVGIRPLLCFIVKSCRIACRCLQTKRGAICYRMNVSRASETPCGSSYGFFCSLIEKDIETGFRICPNRFWLKPVFNQTGFLNVLAETGSVTGFRFGSRPP